MLRAASSDAIGPVALLRDAEPCDCRHGSRDLESSSALAASAASPAASLLAHELQEQRLLLQKLEGTDLALLPSVQRMKSLHAAFKPLRQLTRDAVAFFSLTAALERAIRDAYPFLAPGGGGLQSLLQQDAAAADAAAVAHALRKDKRPPPGPDSSKSHNSSSMSCSGSNTSSSGGCLRCMRLVRDAEGPKVEYLSKEPLSTEEMKLCSFLERLQQHAAAAARDGEPAGDEERREWLVVWRLSGYERKVTHALVALTTDLDSFSVSSLDIQHHHDETPPTTRQPQHHNAAHSKRKVKCSREKALVICRKQNASFAALPPISLSALLVSAVTASI